MVLLLSCPATVFSWSSSSVGSKTTKGAIAARHDRVDRALSLLEQLKEGKSFFHPGISLVSEGGDECGIQLQPNPTGLQLETDDVIFVDREEFLTPQSGLETPVGQVLQWYLSQPGHSLDAHPEKQPHIYLAIYLVAYKEGLLRRLPDDAGTHYLETLPSISSLRHLPVFWDDSMLEELQCSNLKQGVRSRRDEWKQEFLLVRSAVDAAGLPETFRSFTLETWYWARSIITSRGFTDYENKNYPCLCPYVDMMNHVTGQQAEGNSEVVRCTWDIDSKGYHLRLPSGRAVSDTGEKPRLEISYGSHSNAHFLMNYGFSIPNDQEQAEEDVAILPIVLPDSVHEQETESLWEADGQGDCHLIARNVTVGIGDAGPMESVLSMCRVASAQYLELSHMKEDFAQQGLRTDESEDGLVPQLGATLCRVPFSVANEIRALKMLQSVTKAALSQYPTTMQEDTNMLSTGRRGSQQTTCTPVLSRIRGLWNFLRQSRNPNNTSENIPAQWQWLNAVTVRREEKKIIQHYFVLASIRLNILEEADADEQFELYKGMLDASLHDREPLLAI